MFPFDFIPAMNAANKKPYLKLLYEAGLADRFHTFLNVVLQDKTSQTTQPLCQNAYHSFHLKSLILITIKIFECTGLDSYHPVR